MGIEEPSSISDDDETDETRCRFYYEEMEFENYLSCTYTKWIENIDLDAKEMVTYDDNGNRDNLMYNPPFATHFLYLCRTMLLWSGICCHIFNSSDVTASSGNAETNFSRQLR